MGVLLLRSIAAQGGGADLSYSATWPNAAVSSEAGYIIPEFQTDGTRLQVAGCFFVSAPSVVDTYFSRAWGGPTSISLNYSVVASTNTVSGTHFTASSGTITFADKEYGLRRISVPILAIPQGMGLVCIRITSGKTTVAEQWIWLQGSGTVSGAKFAASPGAGTNSAGNMTGDGSIGNPYLDITRAGDSFGNSGGVLYLRAGTYRNSVSRGDVAGWTFSNKCAYSAPLIVMPYPGESVIIDQLNTGDSAVTFDTTGASYVWIDKLRLTRGNWSTQYSPSGSYQSLVVSRCEIDTYNPGNVSNVGGCRADYATQGLIQDCNIHDIKTDEGGANTPAIGVIHFRAWGLRVVHCSFDNLQKGVMQKQGDDSLRLAVDVGGCLFTRMRDYCVGYQVQGNGTAGSAYGVTRYSAYQYGVSGNTWRPDFVNGWDLTEAADQNGPFDIYSCTTVGSKGICSWGQTNGVRYWNNISQDSSNEEYISQIDHASPNTTAVQQLLWSSYNRYVRSNARWQVGTYSGGGAQTYTSLATWQGASNQWIVSGMQPDLNSSTTSTTPSYTDAATYDFRYTNTLGLGSRSVGVGSIKPGVAN